MEIERNLFDAKIKELREAINDMNRRLDILDTGDADKMKAELLDIRASVDKKIDSIKNCADNARSKAAAEIAKMHFAYFQNMKDDMMAKLIGLVEEEGKSEDALAEAKAIFTEYAFDFAMQTMQGATVAAYLSSGIKLDIEKYCPKVEK